jgi:hypothetical protein
MSTDLINTPKEPEITWPRPKAQFGPEWWNVFQDMAAEFPHIPNRSDRIEFDTTFRNMLKYLPCPDECRTHAKNWVAANPPELDSKEAASKYMCKFHNSVRRSQGKPERDCNTVLRQGKEQNSCPNCNTNASVSDSISAPAALDDTGVKSAPADKVSRALIASKEKKKELFMALCDQYKVEKPKNFEFAPCPTHPETSCIDYNDLTNITPYLNPYTDSDKQVLHEFEHYRALKEKGLISDEDTAEKFAYEKISKAYPKPVSSGTQPTTDNGQGQMSGMEAPKIEPNLPPTEGQQSLELSQEAPPQLQSLTGQDESNADVANVDLIKTTQPKPRKSMDRTIQDIVDNSSVAVGDIDTSLEGDSTAGFDERFPNYAKLKKESEMKKAADETERKLNDGFITYLDPVYKFPAQVLGLKPGHMNLAHTPEIIHNIVMTLVQSNTTAVGSGLFAFITGISLFAVGYFAKSSISFKDQLALQNISAAFLWRTLQYINPKEGMKKQLKNLFGRVQDGDLRLTDALIETPGMWKKKERKRDNAWMNMPHKLVKDEKGRPAFMIPAPYAMAALGGSPGAPMGGLIGDSDRNSIGAWHSAVPGAGTSGEQRSIMMGLNPEQDPMYQIQGNNYYDIGDDEGDEYVMPSLGYGIDADIIRNVTTIG